MFHRVLLCIHKLWQSYCTWQCTLKILYKLPCYNIKYFGYGASVYFLCRHPCGFAISQLLIYCIPLLPDQALMFCYTKPTVILGLFGLLQKQNTMSLVGLIHDFLFIAIYIFCVYHDWYKFIVPFVTTCVMLFTWWCRVQNQQLSLTYSF